MYKKFKLVLTDVFMVKTFMYNGHPRMDSHTYELIKMSCFINDATGTVWFPLDSNDHAWNDWVNGHESESKIMYGLKQILSGSKLEYDLLGQPIRIILDEFPRPGAKLGNHGATLYLIGAHHTSLLDLHLDPVDNPNLIMEILSDKAQQFPLF